MAIGYLPDEFADELRRWAPPEVSDGEMFALERLAERLYARGYRDGHRRGFDEGMDHRARPNANDVNRLREALAATDTAQEAPDA